MVRKTMAKTVHARMFHGSQYMAPSKMPTVYSVHTIITPCSQRLNNGPNSRVVHSMP